MPKQPKETAALNGAAVSFLIVKRFRTADLRVPEATLATAACGEGREQGLAQRSKKSRKSEARRFFAGTARGQRKSEGFPAISSSNRAEATNNANRKRYLLIFATFMAQLQEAHLEPIYSFCFSTQAFRPLLLQ